MSESTISSSNSVSSTTQTVIGDVAGAIPAALEAVQDVEGITDANGVNKTTALAPRITALNNLTSTVVSTLTGVDPAAAPAANDAEGILSSLENVVAILAHLFPAHFKL